MKRYWIFCYDTYYPLGGMQDFFNDFDDLSEKDFILEASGNANYHIFDSEKGEVIEDCSPPEKRDIHTENESAYVCLSKIYPESFFNNN